MINCIWFCVGAALSHVDCSADNEICVETCAPMSLSLEHDDTQIPVEFWSKEFCPKEQITPFEERKPYGGPNVRT